MKPIPLIRFDALAGYARKPMIRLLGEEVAWFEHANERVLGLIIRDFTDNDFGGHAFGRDRRERFRWIGGTDFHPTRHRTAIELRREMERLAQLPDDEYFQDDEKGDPVDFFTLIGKPERLNPSFMALRDMEAYSAARGIIEPMMRWYEDADGNFVEQFQTTGFDSRIFELYLFAVFTEMNYEIDRIHAVPDFRCVSPVNAFNVEAVTVNPSRDAKGAILPGPPVETPEERAAYADHYMPIKFAGALIGKLNKRYWEKPDVRDRPLLFAVEDFSGPASMTWTRSAFERYVYGYAYEVTRDDGKLEITPRKVGTHRWGTKEVPSGFFELPNSEHVSAILFTNSGTISKFNRMGQLAGFGSSRLQLVRTGAAVNHDAEAVTPIVFQKNVRDPDYFETWSEGIDIWHNPNALLPIDPNLLPGVAHHWLLPDGQVRTLTPPWHPLASFTVHTLADEDQAGQPA